MTETTRVDFTGRIVSGEDIIFAKVSGYYELYCHGIYRSWGGELTIESGETPFLFRGRLITDAGQRGNCIGSLLEPGSTTITFQGFGRIK
jgi:hypothetical protein